MSAGSPNANPYALLERRYAPPEWALMREVAPRTGGGTRYADAVAVNLWSSRGHAVNGFEVKVSRSDWLRELKQPGKAEESVYSFCDHWWIVAPAGIVREGELPQTWGLLEVRGDRLMQTVNAPRLEAKPVTRAFFASLMRRGYESIDSLARSKVQQQLETSQAEYEQRIESEVTRRTYDRENLKSVVEEFERETGLRLNRFFGASPAVATIRIAQRLEKLAGFAHADGSLSHLTHLADELEKAAQTVRGALEGAGLSKGPDAKPTTL